MSNNILANSINIVQSYIVLLMEVNHMTKTDVALELAVEFSKPKSYTLQRLNQWLRGTQTLPKDVYEHMMQEVVGSTEFQKLNSDIQQKVLTFPEIKK